MKITIELDSMTEFYDLTRSKAEGYRTEFTTESNPGDMVGRAVINAKVIDGYIHITMDNETTYVFEYRP